MESDAHLRQVYVVFINLFFFFTGQHPGSCVHFISLGAAAPPYALSLFPLSLSLCSQGKTVKPRSFPSMRRSHVSSVHDRRPTAPQLSHGPASTFRRKSALLGRGLSGALGLLFPAFLPMLFQ